MKRFLFFLLCCLLFSLHACAELVITEVMASNGVYKNGEAYDWIEIHNNGSKKADLSGCFLSDGKKNLQKWAFPKNTTLKAGEYLLVYCTGEEMSPGSKSTFYANFKISADGDQIYLTDKDGKTPLAFLEIPAQYGNISWGLPSGGEEYLYFEEATPGKKNGKTGFCFGLIEANGICISASTGSNKLLLA